MDRRTLLRRVPAAVAVAALGGCLGGGGQPKTAGSEALEISDFNYTANDAGDLVVVVTVTNSASQPATGTLYVDVTANGSANTRVRTVEVEPAGKTDVRATFDVSKDTFEHRGSLSFHWDHESA